MKSVNLISFPASCFRPMSKEFSLSSHLVNRALYCLLVLFLFSSGSSAWWSENS